MTRLWDQIDHVITSIITAPTLGASATLQAMVEHRVTVGQGFSCSDERLDASSEHENGGRSGGHREARAGKARNPKQVVLIIPRVLARWSAR